MACSAMLRYYYGLHLRAAAGPLWAGLTRLASGGGVAIKRIKRKQGGSKPAAWLQCQYELSTRAFLSTHHPLAPLG
jgi:hypothetical protein